MIEAIGSKKTEDATALTPEATAASSPRTAGQSLPVSQVQGTADSAYALKVSTEGRTRQSVLEKCRSDYQRRVRDMVDDGGNAIESHAVAYRKMRDKIQTECPESMRKDAVAMLDQEFEKGVAIAVDEQGNSFGNFFNYANQQNHDYHFNLNDRQTFNVAAFKENVMKMAEQAKTAAMNGMKTDTESLQLSVRKSLGNRFRGAELETMSFGDIRTLDTALRNLPNLKPTDNLQQVGQYSAMWEVIGEHLRDGAGLSKPIREKTLTVLANNLDLYQRIGGVKNPKMSGDSIRQAIDTAREAEKAEFRKGKLDNPLVKLKEKLWMVESEWNGANG